MKIIRYLFQKSKLNNIDISIFIMMIVLSSPNFLENYFYFLLYLFPWLFISSATELYFENKSKDEINDPKTI